MNEVAVLDSLKPENMRAQYETTRLLAGMSADVGKLYLRWLANMAAHPGAPIKTGAGLAADWLGITRDMLLRISGEEVEPTKLNGDRRFKGQAWQKKAPFRVLLRGYQAYAKAALRLAEELLPFIAIEPGLSDDAYRYLWDGRVQVAGLNPYGIAPEDPALDAV